MACGAGTGVGREGETEDGMFYFPNRLSIARLFREIIFFSQPHARVSTSHLTELRTSPGVCIPTLVWPAIRIEVCVPLRSVRF